MITPFYSQGPRPLGGSIAEFGPESKSPIWREKKGRPAGSAADTATQESKTRAGLCPRAEPGPGEEASTPTAVALTQACGLPK